MNITFGPKGILQIDDARIVHRNFEGRPSQYNREGDRNFSVVIPNQELADQLLNDVNEYGTGWNVKIKAPRVEGDSPFIYFPVKVKFNDRGPAVYLKSGMATNRLYEEDVKRLDRIDIASVDLDIRPYDDIVQGKPFRSAYLQAIWVTQAIDRFAERYSEIAKKGGED